MTPDPTSFTDRIAEAEAARKIAGLEQRLRRPNTWLMTTTSVAALL
jgi:hypothetical protein